jgi:AcrR family transcriptional regulator
VPSDDPTEPACGRTRSAGRRSRSTEGATDGRRTRWDAHRAERRRQLVEAAIEVLGEVGPEFGLDQVADRAGVTKPVIYRHFTDRAGLVAAMGERATAMMIDEGILPAALDADETVAERIRNTVDAFLAFLEHHPNIYWLFVRHAPRDGDEVAQTSKEIIAAAVTAALGDVLRAGEVDAGIAEVWARGLIGFVQNTAEWWLERRTMSRESLTDYTALLIWAQMDGLARRYGAVVDPDRPVDLAWFAQLAADRRSTPDSTPGSASGEAG